MSDHEPVDAISPWTIKAVAKGTRDAVINAARKEGLTVGQWLEKRVAEWEAAGSPVQVGGALPAQSGPDPAIADLAALLTAVGTLPEHIPLPGEVRTLINDRARQARGHAGNNRGRPEQRKIAAQPALDSEGA